VPLFREGKGEKTGRRKGVERKRKEKIMVWGEERG